MAIRRIVSHPAVTENEGRVALMRGLLLYCPEGVDLGGSSPDDEVLLPGAPVTSIERPDMLGGIVALEWQAEVAAHDPEWSRVLYRSSDTAAAACVADATTFPAIPYFA